MLMMIDDMARAENRGQHGFGSTLRTSFLVKLKRDSNGDRMMKLN